VGPKNHMLDGDPDSQAILRPKRGQPRIYPADDTLSDSAVASIGMVQLPIGAC